MNGPLPDRSDGAASAEPLGPARARHLAGVPAAEGPVAPAPPFHRGALRVAPAPGALPEGPPAAAAAEPAGVPLPPPGPSVLEAPSLAAVERAGEAAELRAGAEAAAVEALTGPSRPAPEPEPEAPGTEAYEPWAEEAATRPAPAAGPEPEQTPAEAADLAAFAWAEEAALTLRAVPPAAAGEAAPAPGPGPGARPVLLDEVASRLEQIARTLRERRPAEIFAEGAADPLEILITGYALGYTEAARHARQEPSPDPGVG